MINVSYPLTIEDVVSLVRQGIGQMTVSKLGHGWQRLASRLARGEQLERVISRSLRFQRGRTTLGKPRAGPWLAARPRI
jgi:hypothetical protein